LIVADFFGSLLKEKLIGCGISFLRIIGHITAEGRPFRQPDIDTFIPPPGHLPCDLCPPSSSRRYYYLRSYRLAISAPRKAPQTSAAISLPLNSLSVSSFPSPGRLPTAVPRRTLLGALRSVM
jgi:hypothetical protein